MPARRTFLTAEWHDLVLLNYEVEPDVLAPLVPRGTELDAWDGATLASMVGFRFLDTRLRGWAVPFHRFFEEVNLRFYVRRRGPDGAWRRGVVFVRELVPRRAVAWVARQVYNEPYLQVPMNHAIERAAAAPAPVDVRYGWVFQGVSFRLGGRVDQPPRPLDRPSEAEFITEHYWGYTRQRDGGTLEYEVEHPSWNVASLVDARLEGDTGVLYGPAWETILAGPPRSAFYADGSAIAVYPGRRLAV